MRTLTSFLCRLMLIAFAVVASGTWAFGVDAGPAEGAGWTRISFQFKTYLWKGLDADTHSSPRLMTESNEVWDIRPLSTGSEGGREYVRYLGIIRHATRTVEGPMAQEPGVLDPDFWEQFSAAIRIGEATAVIDVDARGLFRLERTNVTDLVRHCRGELASVAGVLWPSLPGARIPLEAAMEWDVPYEGSTWVRPEGGGKGACRSLRVWRDGTIEAAISVTRSDVTNMVEAPGPATLIEGNWRLSGAPLHVVEGSTVETTSAESMISKKQRSVRVLSGALPIWGVTEPER